MALKRVEKRDLAFKRIDKDVMETLRHYGVVAGKEDGGDAFPLHAAALDVLMQHFEREPSLQVDDEPEYESFTLKNVEADVADRLEGIAKSLGVSVDRVFVAIGKRFAARNRSFLDLTEKHGPMSYKPKGGKTKGVEEDSLEESKPVKKVVKPVAVKAASVDATAKPVAAGKEISATAKPEAAPKPVEEVKSPAPIGWGTAS